MLTLEQFKQKIGPTNLTDEQLDKLKISLYYALSQLVDNYVKSRYDSN